jgi:transcriptional regulator of acetoin/glycerol metabolism
MAMSSADERKVWGEERLLNGEGSLRYPGFEVPRLSSRVVLSWRAEGDLPMEDIVRLWKIFANGIKREEYQSDISIFPCWLRCREDDSSFSEVPVRLRRAPDISARLGRNHAFIQAAKPILRRFSNLLGSYKHVVCIADVDSILLDCVGNDTILKVYGLLPGYDWSEEVMGINGTGTSLAIGRPVAVLGPDHYQLPFRDSVCLGSSIVKGKEVIGAVDLRIHVKDAIPSLLKDVILLAEELGSALDGRPE